MSTAWNCFSKTFGFFDVYTQQPKLRSNRFGRFTTCCGVFLSAGLLLACLLIFVPAANSYVKGKYIEQTVKNSESAEALKESNPVIGRDIFMAISVRRKNTTEEVDISPEMNSFMKLSLIQVDKTDQAQTEMQYLPTEPCPANYLSNFDSGVNLKYCWKPVDGLKLDIYGIIKYLQFSFLLDCKLGVACTNSFMSSAESSFIAFWQTHTYVFYFTTRYLDSSNTVRWRLNKAASFSFLELTTAENYVTAYLTTDYYHIDDSVLPNRQNRTIILEGYEERRLVSQYNILYIKYYGIGVLIASQQLSNHYYRYYNKLDSLIGTIGGGVFILFVIFSCVGYPINRHIFRQRLVDRLYLAQVHGQPQQAVLPFWSRAPFAIYNSLTSYDAQKEGDVGSFVGSLQHYRHMYQRVVSLDTDIVALLKRAKILQRLLSSVELKNWRSERELLTSRRPIEAPDSATLLSDEQQRQMDLMGWNQKVFNDYEDIIKRDLQEHPESKEARKNKQLTNTDAYQLVFSERMESLPAECNRLLSPPTRSCKDQLYRFLSFIDSFKVQPRFRANGLLGKEKSPFVGCLCIVAFVLAVLLLFTAFGYFATTKTQISLEHKSLPLNDIKFNVTVGRKGFGMAICFLDSTGAIKNMANQFNSYATMEMVLHQRHGSNKTQSVVKLNQMGDPLKYFNDDGKFLTGSYGNCYALPLGQRLVLHGNSETPDEAYFSIRIKQQCQNPSTVYCAANLPSDRTNTLSIIAGSMFAVISKGFYNPQIDDLSYTFGRSNLFRQRNPTLNSSVYEQIEVDWVTMYNDTSISRDSGFEMKSSINVEEFFAPVATVLAPDNEPVSYELAIRPSGLQTKVTLVATKADEMFGMIGGVLLFMYYLVGILARPYREFLQRIGITNMIYRNKDAIRLSYCDELLFYLLPFKSLLKKDGRLGLVKMLNAESEDALSIQNIIERQRTSLRLLREMQLTPNKQGLSEVYIKESIKSNQDLEQQRAEGQRVANNFQEEEALGVKQNGSSRGNLTRHQLPPMSSNDLSQQHSSIIGINQDQNTEKFNGNVSGLIEMDEVRDRENGGSRLVELKEEDEPIPDTFNLEDGDVGTNQSSLRREEFYKTQKSPLKRSIHNSGGIKNLLRNLFAPQNPISRLADLFGVEGEMTIEGAARYGSCCGGILTILCTALIIGSIFYFAQIYTSKNNYLATMSYVRFGSQNNLPNPNAPSGRVAATTTITSQQTNNFNQPISQNLTTSDNIRMAVTFVSGRLPNIQDVSSMFEGNNPNFRIIGVQAQINRTNRSTPVYSERTFTFKRCPSNYLNDGQKFLHEDFGVHPSIELGYCFPDNVTLQLFGDADTDQQRWFYISVAMLPCKGCTTSQSTNWRNTAYSFFNNYSSRLYLSDPILEGAPFRYDFQKLLFGKASITRNTVENVSIDLLDLIEDRYLLQPPDVSSTVDYRYLQNVESNYFYTDANTFFKNLTFSLTGNRSRYVHTHLKGDQILGMLGGFSFFIILIFRFWARRHNKYKMYLSIGSHLLVKEAGVEPISEEGKTISTFKTQSFSEWEIFKFSTFSFFYKRCACLDSARFKEADQLMKNVHEELDLVNYLKVLNYTRGKLRNNFMPRDRPIVDMHVKNVVRPLKNLQIIQSDLFIQKIDEFASTHELSPYEKSVLVDAIDGNLKLTDIFGATAGALSNMPRRAPVRNNKPSRRVHLQPLEHAQHEVEEGISGLNPIED